MLEGKMTYVTALGGVLFAVATQLGLDLSEEQMAAIALGVVSLIGLFLRRGLKSEVAKINGEKA